MKKYITNTKNKKTIRIENGEYKDAEQREIDELIELTSGHSATWELTRNIHAGEWRFHEFRRIGGDAGTWDYSSVQV